MAEVMVPRLFPQTLPETPLLPQPQFQVQKKVGLG